MVEITYDVMPESVYRKSELKSEEFHKLLEKITYASKETKKIWREIYDNALEDRSSAYLLFSDLYRAVANSAEGHAIHGKQIAQYLERMNRCNDQLLKLAELVEAAQHQDEEIDQESLYKELENQ